MRRMTSVISWAAFCCVLAIGAAAAQDKDENAEANAQAEAYWGQLLAKCGESYLYKGDKYASLHEYRDVTFQVIPRLLSEADRLNGIRWAGTFSLWAKASRKLPKHSTAWDKWKDGGSLEFRAQDLQGKWSFFRRQLYFRWVPVSFDKPSCDLVKDEPVSR